MKLPDWIILPLVALSMKPEDVVQAHDQRSIGGDIEEQDDEEASG